MASMIFTIPELDTAAGAPDITPDQEHKLLAGMKKFGERFNANYDATSVNTATAAIVAAMTETIGAGAAAYFHDGTDFVRVYHPEQTGTGPNITFKEAADGSGPPSQNRIRVEKDNTHHMVLAAPIGEWEAYRDAFARQTTVDYVTDDKSTEFFAAAVLISRCK